jgi:hypothetical protein
MPTKNYFVSKKGTCCRCRRLHSRRQKENPQQRHWAPDWRRPNRRKARDETTRGGTITHSRRARRIGISVSRRTQVTEPALRTPHRTLRLATGPRTFLHFSVSTRKRPRGATHEGGHPHFSSNPQVPHTTQIRTLSYSALPLRPAQRTPSPVQPEETRSKRHRHAVL